MTVPAPLRHALLLLALLLGQSLSASAPIEFLDAGEEARFNALIGELRCLVCQNQNLKDSDAPLAQDLRNEVLEQIRAGRSDDEIKNWMVERYGEFVLYRPAFNANTALLWVGPLLLLGFGALILWLTVRRRARMGIDSEGSAAP